MTLRFRSAALACGLLGAFTIPSSAPQDPVRDGAGDFTLEAGPHSVEDLINRSAQFLGRNYVYSSNDMQNAPGLTVTLQKRLVLDAVGCEEVVGQLAYTQGLVMLPIDVQRGLYEWIHMQGPKRGELASQAIEMSPDEVLRKRHQRIPVLVTMPLEHINTNQAVNQLRPFFSNSGNNACPLTLGAAADSILLQGLSNNVANAISLLRRADTPPGRAAEEDGASQTWRGSVERRLSALEKVVHGK